MGKERFKKNNQTWIKAKSLPIGRGIKQKAYLPLYLKPASKNPTNVETKRLKTTQMWDQEKRKEICWQPAKIKERVRKTITKYMNIYSFMYLL